jgi:hypothetical protein
MNQHLNEATLSLINVLSLTDGQLGDIFWGQNDGIIINFKNMRIT